MFILNLSSLFREFLSLLWRDLTKLPGRNYSEDEISIVRKNERNPRHEMRFVYTFCVKPKKGKVILLWLWKAERNFAEAFKDDFISSSWFLVWLTWKIHFFVCLSFIRKKRQSRNFNTIFSLSADVSIVSCLWSEKNFKEKRNLVTWQFNTFFSRKETYILCLLYCMSLRLKIWGNLKLTRLLSFALSYLELGEEKMNITLLSISLHVHRQLNEGSFMYVKDIRQNFLVRFLLLKLTLTFELMDSKKGDGNPLHL
jgi:hypothetical protein